MASTSLRWCLAPAKRLTRSGSSGAGLCPASATSAAALVRFETRSSSSAAFSGLVRFVAGAFPTSSVARDELSRFIDAI